MSVATKYFIDIDRQSKNGAKLNVAIPKKFEVI